MKRMMRKLLGAFLLLGTLFGMALVGSNGDGKAALVKLGLVVCALAFIVGLVAVLGLGVYLLTCNE